MNKVSSFDDFQNGLVFGFDVGAETIGYAVRKGAEFRKIGVLLCNAKVGDLSKRRQLRLDRRRLRSQKKRREWFAKELTNLGFPKPTKQLHDPISIRLHALNGDSLEPEELHGALTHLFKRRGYSPMPWAKSLQDDEEGKIKSAVKETIHKLGGRHPCQFLAAERYKIGKSPTKKWARKIYWPQDALRDEFLAIAAAQRSRFPVLAEKADWLLYGETKMVKGHHVFFKTTRHPGVLSWRWPRFDNRKRATRPIRSTDEHDSLLHPFKRSFTKTQWELALRNFRVLDAKTRQKIDPGIYFPVFIENVRNEWNKQGIVTEDRLKELAKPFRDKFRLLKGQRLWNLESDAERTLYLSPAPESIPQRIGGDDTIGSGGPILQSSKETADEALNRYLAGIKHPLVQHRLALFRRLLAQLASRYGQPAVVVLEVVPSLGFGHKAANKLKKENATRRENLQQIRQALTSNHQSTSGRSLLRYQLWLEAKGRCPFCLKTVERTDLGHGADIEHLVPRAKVDCNEFYNLTVAHINCIRALKGERIPRVAFGGTPQWPELKENAKKSFPVRS